MTFPMWVISVKDVLTLTEVLAHQDLHYIQLNHNLCQKAPDVLK